MLKRLRVQIPAMYTGKTLFTLICCKNSFFCLKKIENKQKEARGMVDHNNSGVINYNRRVFTTKIGH